MSRPTRVSPWRGLMALVIAFVLIGFLALTTPQKTPTTVDVAPNAKGLAKTSVFYAKLIDVTSGAKILGTIDRGYSTPHRFVMVTVEVTARRRTITFLEASVETPDGRSYAALSWLGLSGASVYDPSVTVRTPFVFEVPAADVENLTLRIGPELRSGLTTLQDTAVFDLPSPLPRSDAPLSLPTPQERAR